MEKTKPILEIKELSLKLDGKTILDHLSMEFWPGYVHAVVGPNGAGKTALANTIMGIPRYRNVEGDILFKGESIKKLPIDHRARQGITLTWQEPARYEGLTVERFINAASNNGNFDKTKWALNQVGLEPNTYLDRALDQTLSGGERKRIEVASILTMEPKVVMMDEPDSGIDVDALEKIFDVIQHLREKRTTVLLITHSSTVLSKADHAFLICCGQLIEKGDVDKIQKYFGEKCIPCDHKNQPNLEDEVR